MTPKGPDPFLVNFLGGAVQATLVTVTGYPFDLVKARLQTKRYANSWECIRGTVQKEGIMGLYRGSSMPWASHLLKRPIQFAVSEYLKELSTPSPKQSQGQGQGQGQSGKSTNLKYLNNYGIGALSGVLGPLFGTPLQVVKVAVQTSTKADVKNSWDYIKDNYRSTGIRGFYRGFWPTVMKDSVFGMSFVGSYYTLRDILGTDKWYKNFASGSMAHCSTWFLFIPIDYVKTHIQRSKKPLTVTQVIRSGFRNHGITVFWKGVIPACARTIPVSGIAMTGYEYVRKGLLASSN